MKDANARLALPLLLCCLAAPVLAEDMPAATPYRPTVSNPAELSAPGWLEIEAGWARTRATDFRQGALPYTLKYAFDEDWGMLVGGNAYQRDSGANSAGTSGFGDTGFILKRRFKTDDDDLNYGLEGGFKVPTARTGLGSGKPDWGITGIASLDVTESWRFDANLGLTRLGARSPGEGKTATLWAATLSKSLDDWTLAAEYSGTRQRGLPNSRQWLVAASYAVTPRLVVDIGTARNRQGSETERMLFFGLTWLATPLF